MVMKGMEFDIVATVTKGPLPFYTWQGLVPLKKLLHTMKYCYGYRLTLHINSSAVWICQNFRPTG